MRYRTITSPSNPLIKKALSIKKKRVPPHLLIEGHLFIEMALSSGVEIGLAFFTPAYRTRHESLLGRLFQKGAELIETSDSVINKLTETEAPQGIVSTALYRPRTIEELKLRKNPLIVVVDGIQDPGNLGTIIRTADAAGADGVIILPGSCDVFIPKVLRSTAGSIFNLPVAFAEPDALGQWLKKTAINLIGADPHASMLIYEADLRQSVAFVFGSEAQGISKQLKQQASCLVRIPISGKAESLNVASSAAVCLYEALRQRTSHFQLHSQCQ